MPSKNINAYTVVGTLGVRWNLTSKFETNLAEMSRMYGQKFYEYHKIFSQRCAAALAIRKKINWAEKEKDLLQMIISGIPANICGICGEVSYTTPFCPRHMHFSNKHQDSRGSSKINEIMHNGVQQWDLPISILRQNYDKSTSLNPN